MNARLKILALAAFGGAGLLAPAIASASTPGELREIRCRYLEHENGRPITLEAPNLHVLSQTAAPGQFEHPFPHEVSSFMCTRTSIIPAANDDEVLWLGVPLVIAEVGRDGRLGVLESIEGVFRFRFVSGEARPGEQAMLDARLAEFQNRFQALQRLRETQR